MDGVAALTYLNRRLAEAGLDVGEERTAELYDAITEGRDEVLTTLALVAPDLFATKTVALEVDVDDTSVRDIPDAEPDPVRVVSVRASTGRDLVPSLSPDFDSGEYVWISPRSIKVVRGFAGDITVRYVPAGGEIDETTADTAAAWSLPRNCHRAAVKQAAVIALTADEESDARIAMALYTREIERLERLYGDYDTNQGAGLRVGSLASFSLLHDD